MKPKILRMPTIAPAPPAISEREIRLEETLRDINHKSGFSLGNEKITNIVLEGGSAVAMGIFIGVLGLSMLVWIGWSVGIVHIWFTSPSLGNLLPY